MEKIHGYVAVDVFFVLSGVVICNAYEGKLNSILSVANFIRIRLIRLYPLYILGTAISAVTIMLGFGPEKAAHDLILLIGLSALFLPNPVVGSPKPHMFPLNFPAWSLFYELVINIFYACVLRFLTNRMLLAIMLFSGAGFDCMRIFPS